MAKSSKRIIWGILLLLLATGLILLAFFPQFSWFAEISAWKWFVALFLLFFIIDRLFFAKSVAGHFDFIIPLAILFLVFKKDIARAAGLEPDFVNSWLVLITAFLLTCAAHLLFSNKPHSLVNIVINGKKFSSDEFTSQKKYTYNVNSDSVDENSADKDENTVGDVQDNYHNNLAHHTIFFDVSAKTHFEASNELGQLNVFFQNTNLGDTSATVYRDISNELVQMDIRVPANWIIENRINNTLGQVNVKTNGSEKSRTIVISGTNTTGQINIRGI